MGNGTHTQWHYWQGALARVGFGSSLLRLDLEGDSDPVHVHLTLTCPITSDADRCRAA